MGNAMSSPRPKQATLYGPTVDLRSLSSCGTVDLCLVEFNAWEADLSGYPFVALSTERMEGLGEYKGSVKKYIASLGTEPGIEAERSERFEPVNP